MKLIIGLLLFNCVISFSQETKFILKRGDFINEEYYVLKTNKKIKHGTYIKYAIKRGEIFILENGNYINGEKNGVWEEYYDVPYTIFTKKNLGNNIKERTTFLNGHKNGPFESYYFDTLSNNLSINTKKRWSDSLSINIEHNNIRLKLKGEFQNDKKVEEWISFDFMGNISQRYNFTKSKLLFDSSIPDSLNYNFNRQPLFIGGIPCLNDFLIHEFNPFKTIDIFKNDSLTVIIQFTIDSIGQILNPKVVSSNSSPLMEKEVIRIIKSLNYNWIPALRNGQLIQSDYMIAFDLICKVTSSNKYELKTNCRPMINYIPPTKTKCNAY